MNRKASLVFPYRRRRRRKRNCTMWPAWEAIPNTGSLLISPCFTLDEDGEWLSFKLSLRGFLAPKVM